MNILLLGRKDIAKSEDIISAMKNIGHSVDFLLFSNFHYNNQTYLTSIGLRSTSKFKTRFGYYFFQFFSILYFLFKNFRQKKYDILFAIDWFEGVIMLVYKFLFAKKSKIIFYGYDFYFFDKKLSSRYIIFCIDRWVARKTNEVWVVNKNIQNEREKKGIFSQNSKIVPLGITNKKLHFKILNIKHFLFVGKLKEGHNLRLLVQVFADLIKLDNNYKLTIIGLGNLFNELNTNIIKSGVKENIYLRGFVPEKEISKEIESGKYTAGIALYENNKEIQCVDPSKIKDYFSWTLPVITTPYSILAQDIYKYNLGNIVTDSYTELIQCIQNLSLDNQLKKQLALKQYIQDRSFEEVLKKYLPLKN